MNIKVLRLFSSISATSSPYVQFTKGFQNVNSFPLPFFDESKKKSRFMRYIEIFREAKILLSKHKIDVLHCHNIYLLPIAISLKLSKLLKVNVIFTMHTSYSLLKTRDKILLTLSFYFLDSFVSCGSAVRDGLPQYIRNNKISVLIRNSVNLNNLSGNRSSSHGNISQKPVNKFSKIKMYSACRLNAGKNIIGNISLVEQLKNLHIDIDYHIFGGGPLEQILKTKFDNKSYLIFEGLTSRNNLYASMQNMDVFISQSKGEGLPVAPLEALLSGKAAILSDIPSHNEFLEFFPKSTLIVKKDTHYDEIAKFLNSWLEAPVSVNQEVLKYFHVNRMEREYINVYKK